jgi:hypothetical protein
MGATQPKVEDRPGGPNTAEGSERREPGKPTRATPPHVDEDAERIGRQQGTTQRGFAEDERPPPGMKR